MFPSKRLYACWVDVRDRVFWYLLVGIIAFLVFNAWITLFVVSSAGVLFFVLLFTVSHRFVLLLFDDDAMAKPVSISMPEKPIQI